MVAGARGGGGGGACCSGVAAGARGAGPPEVGDGKGQLPVLGLIGQPQKRRPLASASLSRLRSVRILSARTATDRVERAGCPSRACIPKTSAQTLKRPSRRRPFWPAPPTAAVYAPYAAMRRPTVGRQGRCSPGSSSSTAVLPSRRQRGSASASSSGGGATGAPGAAPAAGAAASDIPAAGLAALGRRARLPASGARGARRAHARRKSEGGRVALAE